MNILRLGTFQKMNFPCYMLSTLQMDHVCSINYKSVEKWI